MEDVVIRPSSTSGRTGPRTLEVKRLRERAKGPESLEFGLIGARYEHLEVEDSQLVLVAEEREEAAGVELSQCPGRTAEDEVGLLVAVRLLENRVDEAHRLEGHL